MSDIVVFGSLNMDITVRVAELPRPGETVLGGSATYTAGGKGGNQAAAAARLLGTSGRVRMVGLVGQDGHGEALVADLRASGVDVGEVAVHDGPTGIAMICVDDAGENVIVVSPGANDCWEKDHVQRVPLAPEDTVVCQLEIPSWVVADVVDRAAAVGARVVLNAAPPRDLSSELLADLSMLVVNESEAQRVLGDVPRSPAHLDSLSGHLECDVIVTLGARGAYARPAGAAAFHVPAFDVEAVSAVGAGDAFVGALVVAMSKGADLAGSVRRACAAGALAAASAGARDGLPDAPALDHFLEVSSC